MERLKELLEKRKNLTANIFEEEELIEISKTLSNEDIKKIDPELLTYSNTQRLYGMSNILDRIGELIKRDF